jgi:ubiquinone/menaquinone biosynthesis C-methylase UbiE
MIMMSIFNIAVPVFVFLFGTSSSRFLNVASFSTSILSVGKTSNNKQILYKNNYLINTRRIPFQHISFAVVSVSATNTDAIATTDNYNEINDSLQIEKLNLLGLLRARPYIDPVLADPITKEDIVITTNGLVVGGNTAIQRSNSVYEIKSLTNQYEGSSSSYINLLEPIVPVTETTSSDTVSQLRLITSSVVKQVVLPFMPPPIRSIVSSVANTVFGNSSDSAIQEYIPMRDLFTSPAVSYAYERGWRQGFVRAGFPGPDIEAKMAMEYFTPSMVQYNSTRVLVDMSCATGMFTRRFVASQKYKRVLGCDYSDSMLQQARQFINNEKKDASITSEKETMATQLDLIRLDVGQIPMKSMSVDSVHAGAAMHCWPDLQLGISEIHRILKPGGRYFATTFLSSYFSLLRNADGSLSSSPSQQAFQYFASPDDLTKLLMDGGFEKEKISVQVLDPACVVIRCEK